MKIAFCGDLVLRNPDKHSIGPKLKSILKTADIKAVNFEAPIEIKNGVGIHKSGPVLSQSSKSPSWVKDNGFNLITLANNHSLDYGVEGLSVTLKAFHDTKITGIGTYNTAYDVTVVDMSGQKIGFLGLTHKEFGCVDEYSGDRVGTAMATSSRVYTSINSMRPLLDKLFVLPHAGVEYMDVPLPEWREVYKSYIDLGADGVFASHPHVPQGWEVYKDRPIFYSLGNFLFELSNSDIYPDKWMNSMLVVIDTIDNQFEVFPLLYDHKNGIVEVDNNKDASKYLLYLNSLLNSDIYSERVLHYMEEMREKYTNMMIAGGAYSMGIMNNFKNLIRPFLGRKKIITDPVHLLNLFQCESHRWTMMKILESRN